MEMLAGTRSGLVDVASGTVVAFAGREVRAVDGAWVVVDGALALLGEGVPGDHAAADGRAFTCVVEAPDGVGLAGTTGAHLYRVRSGAELVEAFDRAAGRDGWYTPWGGPPDARSLAVAPDGSLLVNVHVGGIVRSVDGGASWHPTIDIHADVHQVLAPAGGRAVTACAVGLATSDDGGETWSVHDGGLHATYARSVAVAGATVLLGVSTGPGGESAAVYRRQLGGDAPFERCAAGLPAELGGNVDTFWLAGAPDGTAAFATPTGDVFWSGDEGATWEQAGAGLPPVRCLTLR